MEKLPSMNDSIRLAVNIPVHAYLSDHHVDGITIFPAVEAMQVLAETVKQYRPDTDVTVMSDGRFDKFLFIPDSAEVIRVFVEIEIENNGVLTARLLTKNKSGSSGMVRIKEHAVLTFPGNTIKKDDLAPDLSSVLSGNTMTVSADKIYAELIPFGPAFRNIVDKVFISEAGGICRVKTPLRHDGKKKNEILGSLFCLDAAYHCACVWGQRFANVVAFPVGFEKRIIKQDIRPGTSCDCRVIPVMVQPDLLVFDLWLYDEAGNIFESNLGVKMRDVSSGRKKPPSWIVAASDQRI
jgi:hypothetical protein